MMKRYDPHPLAQIVPPMTPSEYAATWAKDIADSPGLTIQVGSDIILAPPPQAEREAGVPVGHWFRSPAACGIGSSPPDTCSNGVGLFFVRRGGNMAGRVVQRIPLMRASARVPLLGGNKPWISCR